MTADMLPEYGLDGRVALVTGAGTGLGAEIAVALAEAGAHVALAGRRIDALRAVSARVDGLGRRALVVEADVRSESSVAALTSRVVDEFGGLDILVRGVLDAPRRRRRPRAVEQTSQPTSRPFRSMRAAIILRATAGRHCQYRVGRASWARGTRRGQARAGGGS
jgi:NAD(P)-dependent dehydrogenase (short-subunit alcohol dehydrogenase family)